MFKLHKHKSDRVGDPIEFTISNIRAIQIPLNWDRLFLSIISVSSGKTITKSSKMSPKGGICRWPDIISDSLLVCPDKSSKEFNDSRLKIIVSTGSTKTLGELVLNLADHIASAEPSTLSVPLSKCGHGTILELKIQCFSADSMSRDGKSPKEASSSRGEHFNIEEGKSNESIMTPRSNGSFSNLSGLNCPDDSATMDTSFSASGSHRSSHSVDSFSDRATFSPRNGSNGGLHARRQDSVSSNGSNVSAGQVDDLLFKPNCIYLSSKVSGPPTPQGNVSRAHSNGQLSAGLSESAKELLSAEETIEGLRDEAKMWERHSRKLNAELEKLRTESSEKSSRQTVLEIELSNAHAEVDSLKKEVEQQKISLKELIEKQADALVSSSDSLVRTNKELEDEVKHLRESKDELSWTLKNSQRANMELGSIIQELEETVEGQRGQIFNLSQAMELSPISTQCAVGRSSDTVASLEKENENLKAKVEELERDCSELTEENLELLYKLKEAKNAVKVDGNWLPYEGTKIEVSSSVDSFIHGNDDVKDKKLRELETWNSELELLVSDLRQQNAVLSQQISALEGQLQYHTGGKTSCLSQLDETDSEVQNTDLKQKIEEIQRQCLEAEEETTSLRSSNHKLQSKVTSLTEVCSSLQKINFDLRKEKVELHERTTSLEIALEQSNKRSFDFWKKIDLLEAELSSLHLDVALKEQSLLSKLDGVFPEKVQIREASLEPRNMETEQLVDAENLETHSLDATAPPISTHDELEISESDSGEYSSIRLNNYRLELRLKDAIARMKEYEAQLESLNQECDIKVQGLVDLLNATKQSEDMLIVDIEHMRKSLETAKSNEEKFRKTTGELELKLKSSECERMQIMEEISLLKIGTQNLQNEIGELKSSISKTEVQKEKIEERLKSVSDECKALHGNKVELDNELDKFKSANDVYLRRIQVLEQERDELLKKTQLLEMKMAESEKRKSLTGESAVEGHALLNVNASDEVSLQSIRTKKQTDSADRVSTLEVELKEMKERFLNMSLQYAQVEAEREELVMKLKSMATKKGWF